MSTSNVSHANSVAPVLVAGGSGAVGGAICRRLSAAGVGVALTYRTRQTVAEALAAEIAAKDGAAQAVALACDFASEASIVEAVRTAGGPVEKLTALVQAAGIAGSPQLYHTENRARYGNLADISAGDLAELWEANVRSSFLLCRAAAPLLAKNGGGNIVLIGSIDGIKPVPSPVHFATATAALKGLTLALAKELGPDNIRVNLLAPGILDGGSSRQLAPAMIAAYREHSGLKRFGTLAEVAEVAAWFALENTYITGQTITLDGGL